MKKFKIAKMAFSVASVGLIGGAVAAAITTTSCSENGFYELTSAHQNSNSSNPTWEEGSGIKIKRNAVIAVVPHYYYYVHYSNRDPRFEAYNYVQKNANNISTQYELQHVGALVYYVTGKTQVQSIEVWDASNIRHGLKEYKSALPLYEYTDLNSYPCDYTLTRDTKWVPGFPFMIRGDYLTSMQVYYYYWIDEDDGGVHTYSLGESDVEPEDQYYSTHITHIGGRIMMNGSTFDVWDTI